MEYLFRDRAGNREYLEQGIISQIIAPGNILSTTVTRKCSVRDRYHGLFSKERHQGLLSLNRQQEIFSQRQTLGNI
jgi:hypothetical protein